MDAKADWKNPKYAVFFILLAFSGGVMFFAASKFNDWIESLLGMFNLPLPAIILVLVLIASGLSTLAYLLARKIKRR